MYMYVLYMQYVRKEDTNLNKRFHYTLRRLKYTFISYFKIYTGFYEKKDSNLYNAYHT
jgi:hypothetical protein